MGTRKRISDRTFAAMALLALGKIPYEHAKAMGETNFLSLWVRDHNKLHSNNDPDRDEFWNFTPMLIAEHREKTKRDLKIIAKSRHIRKKWPALQKQIDDARYAARREELVELSGVRREPALLRRLRSRGFDKTRSRKLDGTVVKR
jgi:hypothetical protein